MNQKKKILLIAAIVILLGMITGAIILFTSPQKNSQTISIENEIIPTTTSKTEVKLLTWDDPAGFTFKYPEGWTIDKHDEDQENYAHVEFTMPKIGNGNVIVWAKDTTAVDTNAWVKTEKLFLGADIKDVTLGGQPAKQIFLKSGDKIIVGTIYDELLFMIEATVASGGRDWTDLKDTIVNSFVFKPIVQDQTSGGSDEEAVDEEEVIQ